MKKDEEEKFIQQQLLKEEAIKRQIQQALNEQTYDQFRKFAEQQYPGNTSWFAFILRNSQQNSDLNYPLF